MAGYSLDGLQRGIKDLDRNIKILEQSIKDHRAEKKRYRAMIKSIKEDARLKKRARKNIKIEVVRDGKPQ